MKYTEKEHKKLNKINNKPEKENNKIPNKKESPQPAWLNKEQQLEEISDADKEELDNILKELV